MNDEIVKGYKATNKNMQCRGFQFELGKWYKHDGKLAMCESGFHFCEYPSGPWSFYSSEGTRIFEVEAKGVLKGEGPGADLKHVAMEIRLVKEIVFTGNGNTGYMNTGDMNAGDMNTGNGNAGDMNTGNMNAGNMNAGNGNAGDMNTGNMNAGNMNAGNGNTGNGNTGTRNTGYRNTGNRNTGGMNTGNMNTGNGNATDKCSGYLCCNEQDIVIFDKKVKKGVEIDFDIISELSEQMMLDSDIENIEKYLSIPNATIEKILNLHKKHIERRNKK